MVIEDIVHNNEVMFPIVPIGITEISKILKVDRKKVAQWKFHNKLPPPVYELAQGPLWDFSAFIKWYNENGITDNRKRK